MKKVLIGLVVIVVLIGGALFYGYTQMDSLVQKAIETAGTDAIGSEVKVDSVAIDLMGGTASIYGFTVANPPGFSDATMISFDELSVAIDINSLTADDGIIRINSVVARNPFVLYEDLDGRSNVDVVSQRFAEDESAEASSESSSDQVLAISSIFIEEIQAVLQTDRLPEPVNVELGDISLQNLQGTPDEITEQIMGPVMSQISSTVGTALLSSLAGISVDDVRDQAEEKLDGLEDDLNNRLDEALGDDVREGLGNLLRNR